MNDILINSSEGIFILGFLLGMGVTGIIWFISIKLATKVHSERLVTQTEDMGRLRRSEQ